MATHRQLRQVLTCLAGVLLGCGSSIDSDAVETEVWSCETVADARLTDDNLIAD